MILAISGGVDSMVMLDIFTRLQYSSHDISDLDFNASGELGPTQEYSSGDIKVSSFDSSDELIVAHFNHGTRPSACTDAAFVQKYCQQHDLTFILGEAKLGEDISEEVAREYRYDFLKKVSQENCPAAIYTAHHLDDLVESIAINLLRGTGWRGLAVLDTPGIHRPFLEKEHMPEPLQNNLPFDKKALQKYATTFKIPYRQDPTNAEDHYLRNRVRAKLSDYEQANGDKYKMSFYDLWLQQKTLKKEIDALVQELLPASDQPWQRSWFVNLNDQVALELLRAGTLRAKISATRPQLLQFLQAIRTYAPGKCFNLPQDKLVKFSKTEFYL